MSFQSCENVSVAMPVAILWLPGKSSTERKEKSEKSRSDDLKRPSLNKSETEDLAMLYVTYTYKLLITKPVCFLFHSNQLS